MAWIRTSFNCLSFKALALYGQNGWRPVAHSYWEFCPKLLSYWSINSCCISKKLQFWLKSVRMIYFLTLKPIKGKLGFILEIMKKLLGGATSQKSQKYKKPWYLHYYSSDDLGVKWSNMIHLSSSNWFGPLFSSQNRTNSENVSKTSNFSLDFDNLCRFFECHSISADNS